jgi:hypothetical protein
MALAGLLQAQVEEQASTARLGPATGAQGKHQACTNKEEA